MKKLICFSLFLSCFNAIAQFTPGNVVIYRVGDGSAALSTAATAVFLDEYTPTGTLVQSIPMPTAIVGANKRITAAGNATSEGLITRSIDGQYLLFGGYDAAVGTAAIAATTSATVNRVVGRIDAQENLDATTAFTDFPSAGNLRSVVSTNGTDFWATGSVGGVRYATLGATTTTQLSTTTTNIRQGNIFGGQLYITTASGAIRLGAVGTGSPTVAGQTITNLPGFPTSGGSPYGFFFADLDPGVAGLDVVYVADDGAGTGFMKYSLVAGTWVANGFVTVTGNGLRSIAATVSGNSVTFYGVNGASLVTLTDATGYNATIAGTVTTLATAGTNTAFRGVAFAPQGAVAAVLSATSLTSFGNTCINTSAGPNSFTITGTNLSTADVSVAALSGFTYSTTSGGTYTPTLTLTQPGGAYSQQVFVKFDPTAVQSYNGNIVVSGGGATSVNVAAVGSGINTAPTVTSGVASAITQTSATVAGNISATGCTAITAYGIEWSTSIGFANGTGTAVPASNLAGGSFSSSLTTLASGTTYYYHAYATNAGGTSYGSELSFTTTTPNPNITTTPLTAFGDVCTGVIAGPNSFTINGTNLTNTDINVGPLNGFIFSTTAGGTYTASLILPQPGGTYSQTIYVEFFPQAVQSFNGNIPVNGGGIAAPVNVAASGAGVNSAPTVTSGAASAITTTTATVAGTITSTGCTPVTAYGIEWSTTNGFANGAGTSVPSSNNSGGNYTSALSSLTASTTYYYHAYATNGGGTSYGSQGSFSTSSGGGGTVVISQVYPGGGSSSPTVTYKNDYVELHNITSTTQDISGFSLQYGSGTGNFGSSASQIYVFPASTTIAPGKYLLVQLGAAGTGGADLPVTPDFSSTNLSMGAASGKVALVNNSSALGCGATATACALPMASIVDLVAYGVSNNAEGGATVNNGVALPSNTNGCVRKTNGCTDTDNNNNDFDVVVNPVPRNSGSPANICGAPTPTLSISSTLSAFGNICINTTAGPNSFTITGTNLTTADITVAALAGYTYSTTSGGTYTTSLTLIQPGGAYAQQIFVKFDPTAVQSYNGNIVVNGGGAASVNVATAGTGINTAPIITSGAASAITQTTATVAGNISATGCTAITAYGIEWSTTSGFANGTGTAVPASNLAGGNFSSDLSSLASGTTYYYHAYATNAGGTSYGAELSFTTVTPNPNITITALTAFGNVCTGTIAGPNSFTINGTNLTNTDINVGPLNGFIFSTTAGGVYTASLILPQPGGTYSQTIYVEFFPQAVQSFNGNIPVNGGGIAAPVNVAASGAGVNTAPTVTSGAASVITQTTATVAGNISATGCTAVTAYGIEWSTTNGFANGAGTQVASSNNSGGNFTSALSGLTATTTYYYHAYATNAGGTSYGAQQSFTTASPPPPTLNATPVTGFGDVCINTNAGPNSFTINGTNLTTFPIMVGPLNGFVFSETAGGLYSNIISIIHTGGTQTKTVYVRFLPTVAQSYNGNIPIEGGGTSGTLNLIVTGNGVNTPPGAITGAATNITTHSAVLPGTITTSLCSSVTAFGIEYSGISGFANGAGIKVGGTGLSSGEFIATLNNLVPGATYYYKAYATNAGGTGYGAQQSFTVGTLQDGFNIYPIPVAPGASIRFTLNNITPGNYSMLIYNSKGDLVLHHSIHLQSNYINQTLNIPGTMARGVYQVHLINTNGLRVKKTILVH